MSDIVTQSGQLPLTAAELNYLESFLNAKDRGGYYLALYNMTGNKEASVGRTREAVRRMKQPNMRRTASRYALRELTGNVGNNILNGGVGKDILIGHNDLKIINSIYNASNNNEWRLAA